MDANHQHDTRARVPIGGTMAYTDTDGGVRWETLEHFRERIRGCAVARDRRAGSRRAQTVRMPTCRTAQGSAKLRSSGPTQPNHKLWSDSSSGVGNHVESDALCTQHCDWQLSRRCKSAGAGRVGSAETAPHQSRKNGRQTAERAEGDGPSARTRTQAVSGSARSGACTSDRPTSARTHTGRPRRGPCVRCRSS